MEDKSKAMEVLDNKSKVPFTGKLGYSFGAAACGLSMILPTMISYFMTQSLLVPIAMVSIMIAVIKVFDGFTDIIVGAIMDKTRSRFGKARPWYLWGTIPYGIFMAAIFWVPASLPLWPKIILVAIFDGLTISVFGTMLQVARYALISRMTTNPQQKNILSVLGDGIAALAVGILISLAPNWAAAIGWNTTFTMFGIAAIVLGILCFLLVKEDETIMEETKEKVTFKQLFGAIVHNKYAFFVLFVILVNQIATGMMQLGGLYYFTYVIGDMQLYSITMLLSLVAGVVGMFIAGLLMKKTTKAFGISALCAAVCLFMVYFFGRSNHIALIIFLDLALMFGMTTCGSCYGSLSAQTVDYGEWKTGVRSEGLNSAPVNIGQKIGGALGAAIIGAIMAAGGFVEGAPTQSASAISSIATGYILAPAIIFTVVGVVFVIAWNMDKLMPKIQKDLAEKREAIVEAEESGVTGESVAETAAES